MIANSMLVDFKKTREDDFRHEEGFLGKVQGSSDDGTEETRAGVSPDTNQPILKPPCPSMR